MNRDGDSSSEDDVRVNATRQRSIEAAAEFDRAIAAAERDGPSADVHPRVHQATIEAMRSALDLLREQIDAR